MQFDITVARAKSMAERLQAFLTETPKTKLTRSSAIEAVARMLGFNSRNEMLARLDAEAPPAAAASSDKTIPALAEAGDQTLKRLLVEMELACAREIVAHARDTGERDFDTALETETDEIEPPLTRAEDSWAQFLQGGAHAQLVAIQGYCTDYDDSLFDSRGDAWRAAALALVRSSVHLARDIWDGRLNPDAGPREAAPPADARGLADVTRAQLRRVYDALLDRCADSLVAAAERIAPNASDFREAIHTEDPATGAHALILVEDEWAPELAHHSLYPVAVETFSEEVDSARELGRTGREAAAYALATEAMTLAEDRWYARNTATR